MTNLINDAVSLRTFTPADKSRLAALAALAKNGFQQEGIFKNAIYKNGKIYDEIRFALTLK